MDSGGINYLLALDELTAAMTIVKRHVTLTVTRLQRGVGVGYMLNFACVRPCRCFIATEGGGI